MPTPCTTNGRDKPRTIPDRHIPWAGIPYPLPCHEACPGCLPCTRTHCRGCRTRHHDTICPTCVAATRTDLQQIRELASNTTLLTQAVHTTGVTSEALMLTGPVANREAWTHRALSAILGRAQDATYLTDNRDEPHPEWVLNHWATIYQDTLGHTATTDPTAYLLDHLHEFTKVTDPDWSVMADEIQATRTHLQAVLHDTDQGDTAGVNCFDCDSTLERKLTTTGFQDHWTCRSCHRTYTPAEYHFALRAKLETRTAA